jgi:hypothetical protein
MTKIQNGFEHLNLGFRNGFEFRDSNFKFFEVF